MMLFIFGQLYINYKHGMVASPFLHYGMYSDIIPVNNKYGVFEVMVDGENLQGKDYTPQQWDKILLPLYNFKNKQSLSNSMYESDIKRLMQKVHLSANESSFIQTCNTDDFLAWYKKYLSYILKKSIEELNITYRYYQYNGNTLSATDSSISIKELCF